MPLPNTSGQLRTRISEMKIGDYIKADYQRSALDAVDLNSMATVECPLNGTPTLGDSTKYFFYFIKVARGLLIADRVVASAYTWDSLNLGKFAQGRPLHSGNLIPKMTSNTTPSGIASSSTEYSTAYSAWKAFNKLDDGEGWVTQTGVLTGWVAYEFSVPTLVKYYSMKAPSSNSFITEMARDWTFEAWDGTQWLILDTQTYQIFGVNQIYYYPINNPDNTKFSKYRVNVTANNGLASYTGIQELGLYESVGSIRSISGGIGWNSIPSQDVPYHTENNYTEASPKNNEWDKYIVQKDYGTGSGRDDVWHWQNMWTLTQDTALYGLRSGANVADYNKRVVRGYSKAYGMGWVTSNATSSLTGFRPVYEYMEVVT